MKSRKRWTREKIQSLVLKALKDPNFRVFPIPGNIVEYLKNKKIIIGKTTLSKNIEKQFLEALQIKWILKISSDEQFLEAISERELISIKGKVLEAKKRRLMEILVSAISSSNLVSFPTWDSIIDYLENKVEVNITSDTLRSNIGNEFLEAIQIKWILGECKEEYKKYCDVLDNIEINRRKIS